MTLVLFSFSSVSLIQPMPRSSMFVLQSHCSPRFEDEGKLTEARFGGGSNERRRGIELLVSPAQRVSSRPERSNGEFGQGTKCEYLCIRVDVVVPTEVKRFKRGRRLGASEVFSLHARVYASLV